MSKKRQKKNYREIVALINEFSNARDWEKHHTPRNLAVSIAIEAAEILEHIQWHELNLEDRSKREQFGSELADVFIYLQLLAKSIDLDLLEAVQDKLILNEQRFPVTKSK